MQTLIQMLFRWWRVLATGLSFIVFGLGSLILGLLLICVLLPLPFSRQQKQQYARSVVRYSARVYLGLLRTLGLITYEFHCQQPLTNSGQLIIANHPTLLDAILLMAFLPNPNCVVKGAMANNPLTWALVNLTGYISNHREGLDLLTQAVEVLTAGQNLLIFPEGTRTENINDLKFKRGAANIALRANCPIRPIVIDCQPVTLRKHEAWYQVPLTPPHYQLRVLDSNRADQCIDTSRPEGIQARHLTRYWLDLFNRQLQPQG